MIGEENGWFKININGKIGFVSGEFVLKSGVVNNNVSIGGNNKVIVDVLCVCIVFNIFSFVFGCVYVG